jgi:alpha-beta hydrolase superfamily lysophospholipase
MTTTFPTTVTADPASAARPSIAVTVAAWDEPAGTAARGTLVVLVGRGETPASYARFGHRLAADAYRVRVLALDLADPDHARSAALGLLADADLPAPRVLVGSDAGATLVARIAAESGPAPDAVVLAGLAVPPSPDQPVSSWDGELEARTACAAHRRVISEDPDFRRGGLAEPLPAAWHDEEPRPLPVPTLVLHGTDDAVTSPATVVAAFQGAPHTRTHLVVGGRHDVLNDVSHRSVAATIVLFLESLKLGSPVPSIVRDVSHP